MRKAEDLIIKCNLTLEVKNSTSAIQLTEPYPTTQVALVGPFFPFLSIRAMEKSLTITSIHKHKICV